MAPDALAAAGPDRIRALIGERDYDGAVARCRALRAAGSSSPDIDYLYGLACVGAGRTAEAVVALAAVLKVRPDHAGALCALGTALHALGRPDDALGYLELATRLHPGDVHGWVALGGVLHAVGQGDAALDAFRSAVACDRANVAALIGLGTAAQARMRFAEAERAYREALAIAPDNATVLGNLGVLLTEIAQQAEAQDRLAAALALRPDDPVLISNRLYAALYDEHATDDAVVALHRSLGARLAPATGVQAFADRDRDPDRPLVVGYLSPDFRRHPVGFFLHDVLPAHDRSQVRVVALHDTNRRDWMTDHLQRSVDVWHEVGGWSDDRLRGLIAEQGIDVLVELAGHTRGNRLRLLADRAAPLQASWAGYPFTTGVPAVDAVLVDSYLADAAHPGDFTEPALVELPVYACYAPPDYAPPIRQRPADAPPAFGCFANAAKINRRSGRVWAQVLARTPGSTLLIKTHACADETVRDRLAAMLAEAGVPSDRLTLEGPAAHDVLLDRYGDVDVILDCMPYSGSTSVMEALWMGVPTVTLAGRLYHQRHGGAVMHAAGLDDLVAATEADYVDIAVALAHDAPRRRRLRAELRGMLDGSPLRDGAGMARALEVAFRRLWRGWCETTRTDRVTAPQS